MSNNSPISALQKITEMRFTCPPFYFIECVEEKPRVIFKCVVRVCSVEATGYGTSKKNAKLEAATLALAILNASSPSGSTQEGSYVPQINYIGELNSFVERHRLDRPTYQDVPFDGSSTVFLTICRVGEYSTEGYGACTKESKHEAARSMYKVLNIVGRISAKRPIKKRKRYRPLMTKKRSKKTSVQERLNNIKNSVAESTHSDMDWSPLQ